jgi:hypothetical protein
MIVFELSKRLLCEGCLFGGAHRKRDNPIFFNICNIIFASLN